jgi:hypothetical protein
MGLEWDKAPGIYGFTIHFFKYIWDIIKMDLRIIFNDILRKKKVGGGKQTQFFWLLSPRIPIHQTSPYFDPFLCAIVLTKF